MAPLTYVAKNIRPLVPSFVRQIDAGATLVPGDVFYIAADGDAEGADGSAAATALAPGLVVPSSRELSYAAGTPMSVCLFGIVTGFTGLTPGALIFLSNDAKKLDTVAGDVEFCMGYCFTTTEIFLFPGMARPTS